MVGTCLLSPSWVITDEAKFAGSCVGLAFWAMLTELIRRWAREYDRYIMASATQSLLVEKEKYPEEFAQQNFLGNLAAEQSRREATKSSGLGRYLGMAFNPAHVMNPQPLRLRPTLIQQAIRSILYAITFTSAYLIMLVVMSYNAYIFISVILGTMIGHFVSTWDMLGAVSPSVLETNQNVRYMSSNRSPSDGTVNAQPEFGKVPPAMSAAPTATHLPSEGEAARVDAAPVPAIETANLYTNERTAEVNQVGSSYHSHMGIC